MRMTFLFAGKESEVARTCGMCSGAQRYGTYRILVREPEWKIPL